MFTWVGTQFSNILDAYTLGVVSALMRAIAPVALSAMTIWVCLYGWAVLRNEVSESLPTFMWKTFKISLVLSFSLVSSVYISDVSETANGLAMELERHLDGREALYHQRGHAPGAVKREVGSGRPEGSRAGRWQVQA